MKAAFAILLLLSIASATSTHDQILALLQTGTKANDAIDTVFSLLGDLIQSNKDAQYAADQKNETDEWVGQQTIEQFTKIQNLNAKLFQQAVENRAHFEAELQDTKNYLAWNEARQEEVARKMEVLLDEQCYSNQLFVRSIKMNQEALEVVRVLKQDVAGYIINGDSFELAQVNEKVQSVADKLKIYSHLFADHELKSFLNLANHQEGEEVEETAVKIKNLSPPQAPGRGATLAERVLAVLEDLEGNLKASLTNLETNEINAAWELAGWVSLSEAEVETLKVEYERKQVFADRLATQIQASFAQQAKAKIILQESQDALDQAMSELEGKRAEYEEAKAKRDEENAILDEVITMFKKQVASWSGR